MQIAIFVYIFLISEKSFFTTKPIIVNIAEGNNMYDAVSKSKRKHNKNHSKVGIASSNGKIKKIENLPIKYMLNISAKR